MIDVSTLTDEQIMKMLGQKFRDIRLSKDMSQQEMAAASGLSVFSITQAENGHNLSILNIIKGLRGLGELQLLESIISPNPDRVVERKHAHHHENPEQVSESIPIR